MDYPWTLDKHCLIQLIQNIWSLLGCDIARNLDEDIVDIDVTEVVHCLWYKVLVCFKKLVMPGYSLLIPSKMLEDMTVCKNRWYESFYGIIYFIWSINISQFTFFGWWKIWYLCGKIIMENPSRPKILLCFEFMCFEVMAPLQCGHTT